MAATKTPIDIFARTTLLRFQAHAFCQAFLTSKPPAETLDQYFTSSPLITEHGPRWAPARLPFIGRTFRGRRSASTLPSPQTTCDDYFTLLSQTLAFHPDENTFPPISEFLVDATAHGGGGVVSVVAHAQFESVRTGNSWDEDFVYRLSGFDEQGRIGHWEIWADTLSAWDAVGDPEAEAKPRRWWDFV